MVARVSPEDIVIYANGALAAYLDVSKNDLLGAPLDVLARRCQGEIASCFARPDSGRGGNRLVTDAAGRVFESKLYSEGGVLDIVVDEVTTGDHVSRELREVSGTPFEMLTEDELRTARQPERRYITVSHCRLRGLTHLTERLAPMELRLMVNSFVEEAGDAVRETGCTVGETSGGDILGVFGAPRYYIDHPLRAVQAAVNLMRKTAQLHSGFFREGKELPPSSCGIWTGDAVVGTLGSSSRLHYTAIGTTVDLARRLAGLARPGEILLPEHTLTHILRVLPEGWEHVRAERDHSPDLSDFQWEGEEIATLPDALSRTVYLLGPGIQERPDAVELYFDYLWTLRVPGRDTPVPILRVSRPAQIGDALELRDDNVVTTRAAQTLGKYKLIEIVGSGGMGRVWRGVDRFGNAVAIKVLHASEGVSESQMKRFRREAEVMARLPHRNICRVYEMSEFEGIQYLAMEFVDGLPLSDLLYDQTDTEEKGGRTLAVDLRTLISSLRSSKSIREEQAAREAQALAEAGEAIPEEVGEPARLAITRILPIEQTLNIVLRVCDAVQFAHEHGVLHRDLKPGNILLREDGEPLVADFGLAKLQTPDATHSLSISGHVVGTIENMAPEQAESSKDVDERADVYSLGTILYQMLVGRRHFEATGNLLTDAQALKVHVPTRPRSLNPAISPDLEIITLKALRAEPAERYRSVNALAADIERYRRGEVITAKPVTALDLVRKLVQRNRAVTAVTGISLILFIAGTLLSIGMLSQRLKSEQLAHKEANEARTLAESQRRVAEEQTREAKVQTERATQAAKDAEEAANQARVALEAAESARSMRDKFAAESESERAKREEAERLVGLKDEALRKAEGQVQKLTEAAVEPETPPTATFPVFDVTKAEKRRAARKGLDEAMRIYAWDLSPLELQRLDRDPQEVIRRLSKALDLLGESLQNDPKSEPAWMLKGRIHLTLLEFDRAQAAFDKAGTPLFATGEIPDDPAGMSQLAKALQSASGDRLPKTLSALASGGSELNLPAITILQFFNSLPTSRKPPYSTPRVRYAGEIALDLASQFGGDATVSVESIGNSSLRVTVSGAENLGDLSSLRSSNVGSLGLSGAKSLDWPVLASLPLESLDLVDCVADGFASAPRGFVRLRSLRLAGSQLTQIDAARNMPLLEKLDLSGTHVVDLAPILACRRLAELNLTGLNPANLRVIINLPLRELVLSPELITDKSALAGLRQHRTLRVIRADGDPPDQTALEFWRKLDSGGYPQTQ